MQGHNDKRGDLGGIKTLRSAPNKGNAARRIRRGRRVDGRMAVMVLVTAVLLFLAGRAVWRLAVSQKTPDAVWAAGTDSAGSGGWLSSMPEGIVTLAENVKIQEPDTGTHGERGILVAIDPGHGGYDNGSNINGIYEQEITLDIALFLAEELKAMGYDTLLLREDNETHLFPEERVEKAEKAEADIFISIHVNTYDSDKSVSGLETWYCEESADSKQLAKLVQKGTADAAGARDRGLKETDELIVIRDSLMPSCLVETGFLTNKAEREALVSKDYQEKLAQGMAKGIDEFIRLQQENGKSGY